MTGFSKRIPGGAGFALTVLITVGLAAAGPQSPRYDLVIQNGRVMDPESGLDAVRNVGIIDGRVAAVSVDELLGSDVIDAEGLVVAPGFIDLHAHGQDARSRRLQAQDGVTTALDMELGVYPVAAWYTSQDGQAAINYGATVGHIPVRAKVKHGVDVGHALTNPAFQSASQQLTAWAREPSDSTQLRQTANLLEEGLAEGGLGIGMGLEYTPGAGRDEVLEIFGVAARHAATVFVHTRSKGSVEPGSSFEAVQEVIADAAVTGASVQIVHVASSGLGQTGLILDAVDRATANGLDITMETHAYAATSTRIDSEVYAEGWQERLSIGYGDLLWPATGERLTQESFDTYRNEGGMVIGFSIPPEETDRAVIHASVMIASDGLPFITGREHPRGAGTYARVLGVYARERGSLTLMPCER